MSEGERTVVNDDRDRPPMRRPVGSGWRGLLLLSAVAVAGLSVFGALSWSSRLVEHQTEQRLVQEQTAQAATVLTVSVAQVRAPLEAVAQTAAVTDGNAATFNALTAALVGPAGMYSSVTLFAAGSIAPVAHVGAPLVLDTMLAHEQQAIDTSANQPFVIVDMLDHDHTLGYMVGDRAVSARYVVYAERTLNAPGTTRRTDEPFAQLDYWIYLGSTPRPDRLLSTSRPSHRPAGVHASSRVPFGDTELLLVTTPIGHLGGTLSTNLWWIVLLGGTSITIAAVLLTRMILGSRDRARSLAVENAELFERERSVAETLQMGLLPRHLVAPPGTTLATRYWPAGSADLVGGDFYDVFAIDDERWGIIIGDVCGKGMEAASTTSVARHTLRTATRYSSSPSQALHATCHALTEHDPATYCTICYLIVHLDERGAADVTMALGGHPQPLLVRANGRIEHVGVPGTIVGLVEPNFTDTHIHIEPGDTLFLYTDGLTDAPGEEAVPIGEVEQMLTEHRTTDIDTLADLIRTLKRRRRPRGSHDDTAIVLLRFANPTTPTGPAANTLTLRDDDMEDSEPPLARTAAASNTD